ncbi:MAG: prolyl oligopeptidase family serine peptidase [Sulfolobales archaeon]|nr:prolyl oligopeptidase family serine peptidase [Sulfolobales archaeon]MDW8082971.1 prolyl oligopeptidase family serine peptidase [Sulfolobales archaeon]
MGSDPYEYFEKIEDSKVVEWGLSESRKCVESLKPLSDFVYEKALKLYSIPVVYNVKKNSAGVFYIKRDRSYRVVLDRVGEATDLVDSHHLGEEAVIHNYYIDGGGRYFAYFYSTKGADVGELVVVDLKDLSTVDRIQGSISDVVLLENGDFYYTRFFRSGKCPDGVEAPCERVYLRKSGRDELVFGVGLERNYFISLYPSTDGGRALISVSYGWVKDSLYAGPLEDPSKWVEILSGDFRSFFIDSIGRDYLVATYDLGGFGRILRVREEGLVSEVVPELEVALQSATLVGEYVIASYLKDASSQIKIYDLSGRPVGELGFEEPASVFRMYSYGSGGFLEIRYFTRPYQILEIASSSGKIDFKKFTEHPKVVEAEVTEGFTESYDSTKIHYFWVKSSRSRRAAVIYGYGGFRISLTPSYSPWIPLLVELGVDVVIANLRGGSEYGEEWHRAGMRNKKMNVFYDYIAVAEKFKSAGYSIAGFGRSNGGLLMGSVITMKPDLLKVAAIGYPVLDMLKFHKLYIGAAWIPEYGDPEDPADREYLLKYSPYHNVREGVKYPPTIVFTGLYDDRVHPGHALKFYAKLVSYGNKSCLRLETSSGHAGSSPEVLAREIADVTAFILKHLELKERPT